MAQKSKPATSATQPQPKPASAPSRTTRKAAATPTATASTDAQDTQARQHAEAMASMEDEAVALTMLRDAGIRRKATANMRASVVSMAANMILVCVLAFMALHRVADDFYWTTGDGTVYPMLALDQPVLSDMERTTWVTEVVTQAFNMDFNNVNQRLWASRGNFTSDGFRGFRDALKTSGLVDGIIKYRYRLSAVPSAPVVQVGMGELDGIQGWQYQLPMLLTYEAGDNTRTTQTVVVQIVVVRVPEADNPRGMAIARFQSR